MPNNLPNNLIEQVRHCRRSSICRLITALSLWLALCGTTIVAAAPGDMPTKTAKTPLPAGFSYLGDIAPTILQDMRYATPNNFTGKTLPGYQAAECILRTRVARALLQVQTSLAATGYSLKVYDCYRPVRAVRAFAAWARNPKDRSTKDYYPRLAKTALFGKGYIAKRSSHSIGAAVDLTMVRLPAAAPAVFDPAGRRENCNAAADKRPPDNSVDMGTGFDCFDVMSHTDHRAIGGQARANRHRLRAAMKRFGFANYRREWWHFSYTKRRYPRTGHDFIIAPRPSAQTAKQ